MGKVKVPNRNLLPSVEWVRRLADETAAFEVVQTSVVTRKSKQQEMDWHQIITVSVQPDHRKIDLIVQVRQHLSPNAVLGLIHKLKASRPDGVPLLCVPYISPRVAEMCREQQISYLDCVGNCWIYAPGLLLHITGRPNRPTESKSVDPFSTKSSRIVRTLLTYPDRGWQVQQLAKQAEVSLGLVSKVKTSLLEEAYLEERDGLLYVRDTVKLCRNWGSEYRPRVTPIQLFAMPRPQEIERRLAEWCLTNKIHYALTQLAAAWRYSPLVRYDRSVTYIDHNLESGDRLQTLLHHLDAREVETGANCILWITDDPSVFTDSKEFEGVNIVSPLQLYLDLTAMAGRGKDAAEEIFHQELRPRLAGEPKP